MDTQKFHEIFAREVAAISERRKRFGRPEIKLEEESVARDGTPTMRPTAASNVVGLALSGGGIRSAAFCLGAMQALHERGVIDRTDYLSTVSGGGYIGTSMTVAMSTGSAGQFPFTSDLKEGEVAAVQHIRDHSNYLFPQGLLNIFSNVVVYLRGLMANVVLLLPVLLLAAAYTIWSNPNVAALTQTDIAGYSLHLPIRLRHFGITLNLLMVFVLLLALWALWRSTPKGRLTSDVGFGSRIFGLFAVIILVFAFLELQPVVLDWMFNVTHRKSDFVSEVKDWFKIIGAVFATIGTVVGFLGRFLADTLKQANEKPGFKAFATRITIKLAMYLAGAAVPIVLWLVYLYLSFWGIADPQCRVVNCVNDAPAWLQTAASVLAGGSILCLYVIVGVVLFALGFFLNPNSNSLHRLYRDRLSKAFLFDPTLRLASKPGGKPGPESDPTLKNNDLKPEEDFKVSQISTEFAPYHLINAALNIEASKYANRRGRNAEFYIFSPLFTGSKATGYVDMKLMEQQATGLTAGTAMSVSGAAASANMGSATIKPLVPTLAILNVRLGYWLVNPASVARELMRPAVAKFIDKLYFLKELFGLLSEDSGLIYLTDGGHVENLGMYELLRRRCKLIIAIDGEADPEMSFGSLVTLERYARMDLSLRIGLPWARLRDATLAASADVLKTGGKPPSEALHGPHCALGTIYYPRKTPNEPNSENTGVLLYIKSSFTGDENDYVVDYKRRYPDFPHETTADQLFSEEQFEAYRALGFHAAHAAFKGDDLVSMDPTPCKWGGKAATLPLEIRMRQILGLPLDPPAPAAAAAPVRDTKP